MTKNSKAGRPRSLRVTGLFAGVGGLETGLQRSGHRALLLCENEPGAREVLRERFPRTPLHTDVLDLSELPKNTELVAAGFPCQDLSQAGKTAGISGTKSGLIDEVFRLVERTRVPWLLLENVPFMLQLKRGQALDHIVTRLEELGYDWAYRVVDSRSMGLPQRRERVYLVASRDEDPRDVLLSHDVGPPETPSNGWRDVACGFYWTEGRRGLGWAYDAVPTLKAGSTVGIPSPPAIVLPSGAIVKPDIRDAERMQGFEIDWTEPAERVTRPGHRWRLVGNSVTVDVAEWLGQQLANPGKYVEALDVPLQKSGSWPRSAWSLAGKRHVSHVTAWPKRLPSVPLADFLRFRPAPLSARATAGFYSRTQQSQLRFPDGFLDLVQKHLASISV